MPNDALHFLFTHDFVPIDIDPFLELFTTNLVKPILHTEHWNLVVTVAIILAL